MSESENKFQDMLPPGSPLNFSNILILLLGGVIFILGILDMLGVFL